MKEFIYKISDENGIHARPAGMLVKKAAEFESKITIEKGNRNADAKKIFSVMTLGAKLGDEITVKADGTDENAAIEAMGELLKENL